MKSSTVYQDKCLGMEVLLVLLLQDEQADLLEDELF
jgi:hypothetical protein